MTSLFKRSSARVLALSYAVALSLVAGATLAIHDHGGRSVAKQDRLGELINVSGRQRMLSQRIAYLGRLAATREGEAGRRAAEAHADAVAQFQRAHDRLTTGDLVWRADHPQAAALARLYAAGGLDAEVRRYVADARRHADADAEALLAKLDAVTNLHEAASQSIVEDARAFARQAVIIVIALLALEALLIMLPTARRLARAEDELKALATTDPLTGTRNRRGLFAAAEGLIRLGARGRRPVSVLVLDIDHFKRVNDAHGHAVGDEAIRHVVAVAADAIRDSDLIGRVGGEEFVIVCPETSPLGGARVAEKVRRAVEASPLPLGGGALALTVSLGVHGALPRKGDTADAFVAAADAALYEAKRTGRNKVVATAPEGAMIKAA